MALVDLVERVRSALSVSADYDAQIEAGIKSAGRRLLRDYNFPKQIVKLTYPLVAAGSQYLALPADFKKPLGVRLSQFEEATTFWSEPLTRAEVFKLPSPDGVPRHYWVEGTNLWFDTAMPQDGLDVVLWYQSSSWDDNAAWLLADQEDTLFYFAMTRLAPEMRKKEVFEVFAPLWSDERQSLAIYLNELEWDDVTILMREPQAYVTSREMLSGLGTPSIFSLYGRAFVQVEDAAGARALLELGELATLDLADLNLGEAAAFDILPIANGGTGASSQAQAQLNLALRPGIEVQGYDADLAAIAAVSTTAYGRGFLGLVDNAAARAKLSLGTVAVYNVGTSGNNVPLLDAANTWSQAQVTELTGASAKWALRAKTVAVANDSGLWVDATNNFELALRTGAGVLASRIGSTGDSYITGGNVGIGGTPTHLLSVIGTATNARIRVTDNDSLISGAVALVEFGGTDGRGGFIGLGGSGVMAIQADSAAPLALNPSGGYIGVGTNSPVGPVDISGTAPGVWFNESDQAGANEKRWRIHVDGKLFQIGAVNDAVSSSEAAYLIVRGTGTAIDRHSWYTNPGSGNVERLRLESGGVLRPAVDNTQDLGAASFRWANIRAGNGTIVTSDARAKRDIEAIPDEWLDAWSDVEWQRYKFIDSAQAKGEAARWHLGLVAQAVRDAFAARGLDAREIGLLCYDEWEEQREPIYVDVTYDILHETPLSPLADSDFEEEGVSVYFVQKTGEEVRNEPTGETHVTLEAGNRWGLRYDECQAIEAAYQRRRLSRIEAKLAALEA